MLVKARGYGEGNSCLMVLVEIPTFLVSTCTLHATLKTMHALDFYLAFVAVPPPTDCTLHRPKGNSPN